MMESYLIIAAGREVRRKVTVPAMRTENRSVFRATIPSPHPLAVTFPTKAELSE
jgi:hypothetical protein